MHISSSAAEPIVAVIGESSPNSASASTIFGQELAQERRRAAREHLGGEIDRPVDP
jgi:hypothetical protein